MIVQEYLRAGGNPEGLEEKYFIKHNRHGKYPNLCQFKYNMISSDFSLPIVCECRGLILDEANNWEVVANVWPKFFNYGEGRAAIIDWCSATVQEKADGSLAILYFYNNEWLIATSGMPDAAGQVNGFEFTFAELFWKVFAEKKYSLDWCRTERTYLFELMTPYNRVVVQHSANDLKLISMRDKKGEEWLWDAPRANFERVRQFSLSSFEDIFTTFTEINPLQQEGYVVVDGNGNRVKVKHPGYIALHHAKDSFGPREFVRVIRMGETEEFKLFLKEFPEWMNYFTVIRERFEALVTELESAYEKIRDIPIQKDFAFAAMENKMSGALFAIRNKKVATVREYLADMSINNLIEYLDARNITIPEGKEENV